MYIARQYIYQTCLPEIGYLMYSFVCLYTNSMSVNVKISWLGSVATL